MNEWQQHMNKKQLVIILLAIVIVIAIASIIIISTNCNRDTDNKEPVKNCWTQYETPKVEATSEPKAEEAPKAGEAPKANIDGLSEPEQTPAAEQANTYDIDWKGWTWQ